MLNSFVLTLDVDWAPDCVLEAVSDKLIKKGIKVTWFITHDSPAVRRLLKHDGLFDFGIHPNFLPHSTQGSSEEEIMAFLRTIVPVSKIMRTHSLFQSTPLLSRMADLYGVETDVSLLLPGMPHLEPHTIYFSGKSKGLLRIPYFWEDDIEMHNPCGSFDLSDKKYHVPGLKVFDFHPIFIYLNSGAIDGYEALKTRHLLQRLDPGAIEPFINKDGPGAGYFFDSFIDFLANKQRETFTLSDIARTWRKK